MSDVILKKDGRTLAVKSVSTGGLFPHAIGGDKHTPSALAELSAKVSDNDLIGTDDPRLSDDRVASGLRSASTVVSVSGATAPTIGQVLTATGPSGATWQDPTGDGGTPGGSNLDLQYNNAGSFGGMSGFSWLDPVLSVNGPGSTIDFASGTACKISNGANLYLGSAGSPIAGSIEWDGSNFRGYDGGSWRDLDSGGSPGGADHQVQFNDNGSFGGNANLTFDGLTLISNFAASFNGAFNSPGTGGGTSFKGGTGAIASAGRSTAVAYDSEATGINASAYGAGASAGNSGTAGGANSVASGAFQSSAYGISSEALELDSSAIGAFSRTTGFGSTALASNARVLGEPDIPGTQATGTTEITVPGTGVPASWDGNTIIIGDGIITRTFELDNNGSVLPGNIAVPFSTGDFFVTLANNFGIAFSGAGLNMTLVDNGSVPTGGLGGIIRGLLTNNLAGTAGNVAIGSSGFLVPTEVNSTGMGSALSGSPPTAGPQAGTDPTPGTPHHYAIAAGFSSRSTAAYRFTAGTIGGSYDLDIQAGKGLGVWGVEPPSSRPVITGSRSGATVSVLTQVLTALDATGILDDQTTA